MEPGMTMEFNHVYGMFMSRPPPTRETIWPIRTWKADAKEYEKCLAMTEAREMTPDRLRHFAVHYRLQTEALAEEYKQLSERQNDYDDLLFQASDKIREEKEENDWLKGSYADAVKVRDQQVNGWLKDNYADVVKARDQLVEYGLALQKYNRVCFKELHAQRKTIWAQRETIKKLEASQEQPVTRRAGESARLVARRRKIRGMAKVIQKLKLRCRTQGRIIAGQKTRKHQRKAPAESGRSRTMSKAPEVEAVPKMDIDVSMDMGARVKMGSTTTQRRHKVPIFTCKGCSFTSHSEPNFKCHVKVHKKAKISEAKRQLEQVIAKISSGQYQRGT